MSAETSVVSMRDLWKTYDTGQIKVDALRGVDLDIEPGEFTAIIGPSGSGKSTLMHIIGCLDVATKGTYLLDGEDVSDMTEEDLADIRNRRVGFVFQQFNLLANLTACRNVELPLSYAGVPASQRRARAMEALEQVGLADRAEHRPGELSGGQQQRVAVARALVNDPTLILADEPTGNLDSISSRDMLALFGELNRAGRTMVLITHDTDVARAARRIVEIHDGQVTHDELRKDAAELVAEVTKR